MTLNAKIGGFTDFLAAVTQNHSQGAALVTEAHVCEQLA